jgi:hypothetical protein
MVGLAVCIAAVRCPAWGPWLLTRHRLVVDGINKSLIIIIISIIKFNVHIQPLGNKSLILMGRIVKWGNEELSVRLLDFQTFTYGSVTRLNG